MTTTTLRPDATTSNFNWTVSAGTAHGVLSDDSDATYVTAVVDAAGGSGLVVELGTYTLPASALIASTRVRLRGMAGGFDGSFISANAIRADGSGSGSSERAFVNSGISTVEGPAVPWPLASTQAAIDALYINMDGLSTSALGSGATEAYEVYVDLVTVPIPVVVVDAVTPDPYTASTIVPITWVNTLDSDGGAQTHYEAIVTDDNDGDAVVYDSGEVVSGATSTDVGPLVDGDYTVSVRVAQTVNGSKHWSVVDTDTFAVLVATADIDTVAGVATDASGLITVTVERDTGTEAWEYVEVERSIDGGTTWASVRLASFVDATGDADTFVVTDYEVANGQTVTYRARATLYSSGLPITGAWVESSATSWTSTDEWIKAPLAPTLNMVLTPAQFSSRTSTTRAGIFDVIGGLFPVVVADILSAPSGGEVIYRTKTVTEARAFDDLLNGAGGVLLLNLKPSSMVGPGRDGFIYVAVLSVTETFIAQFYSDYKVMAIRFTEIESPPDATAGTF